MADLPIIFSAPMVRALLDGRKTQTRRVLKQQPGNAAKGCYHRPDGRWIWVSAPRPDNGVGYDGVGLTNPFSLPYATGDRLYVREAHALVPSSAYRMSEGVAQNVDPADRDRACVYREGWDRSTGGLRWRPSIHMPRWASRLMLTVTDVRVTRLQEISGEDVEAEGVCEFACLPPNNEDTQEARALFRDLWNSLHGPDAWDENPWVVALTFTVARGNIDTLGADNA